MKVPPLDQPREEIRAELDRLRHPFRIAVIRAKNGFNIGAIIRTAHSFLAREIVLVGVEPWYERAAMGMQRYEHLREVPDEDAFLALARAEGWKLVVFEKDVARSGLWDCDLPDDAVLVFGNEDAGVPEAIVRAAHEIVAIPMYGINHSYPITVAAGIGMAEWARRHYAGGRLVRPAPAR
jgi:tRNA G18 (ribose-2'-O)-methylase SpoU